MTKKPEPVDMSPEAIARRLEDVRQLHRLMQALPKFQFVGPVRASTRS